jgi:hypothetical protein
VCFLIAGAMGSIALGQATQPCSTPLHRQFDFWLGEWEVRDKDGKPQGENRISLVHGGCALLEEWRSARGSTGSSLNLYDASRKRWHQTWVDSSGGLLMLDGRFADGAMTLEGDAPDPKAREGVSRQRIRWTALPDGRVRQLWEGSSDGGQAWQVVFDGYYVRKSAAR